MDSPPKLAGETLIVHHIPLVHCQVSGSHQRCGSPLRKSNNPFSCPENLGLIRTTSLPERDVLQREALVYSSLIQTSSSSDAFEDEGMREGEKKGVRGGSMASDTSSFTSSNSEEALPKVLSKKVHNRPSSLRHNPFLLNAGEDDYEDDDDDDGNNLNGYLEDSSFHLHGNSNAALDDRVELAPFHLHDLGYNSGPFHLHESLEKPWSSDQKGAPGRHFSARLEGLDLLGLDSQHRHGSSGSTLSMDCGEQEWDDDDDDQSMQGGRGSSECCGCSRTYPESFPDFTHGYCSDSSCNSSDGILVNFSTIYNKTNNIVPDKPINLNSSADQSCTSSVSEPVCMGGAEYGSGGGAFYLDLHRSPTEAPQEVTDLPSSSSCLCSSQPQGGTVELDANCNSYHNHEGLLPSETSANDLTSCMQSQARLVVATQNYYKLVTCDVSSHSSPSPAGSSVTSCSDEHSKGSPTQPTEYFLFRHTDATTEESISIDLILKYLCPAVCDVLQDGLRAYTLDIIIGQRRNQPWSVVEASTQLGPSTRVLHSLFLKVSQYSELTNHSMRLNAFILGLLNLQSLEFWFNHIYTHEDIIAAHYHPWGFLPLSQGACQPMFEELLLLLQPLSLLPFDLDLLFEPHQLQKGQEHLRRKELLCSTRQGLDQSARSTFQLMRGPKEPMQLKEEAESNQKGVELHRGRFALRREGTWPRMDGAESKKQVRRVRRSDTAGSESESEGLVLHAGRMNGVGGEDEERERRRERERERDGERDRLRSKQAGWWFQLMQSSQVYIENSAEGSKFVKWEKRKKGSGAEGRRQSNPPPRVGVVEGAEAHHATVEHPETTVCNDTRHTASTRTRTFPQSEPSKVIKGKPSWMGSPPESVLSELKRTNETQPEGAEAETQAAQNLRWGRLFGAGNISKTEKTEPKSSKNPKSRLPSGWLSLDRAMLDLVVQSVGKRAEPQALNTHSAETKHSQTQQDQTQEPNRQTTAAREVRALCHHIATETGHLSFHKGDVLRVLSRADSDWLLCALGDAHGLVPIIYVTLNDEESEDPRGSQ